jgi:hypothetical protein
VNDYLQFLEAKTPSAKAVGISFDAEHLNGELKPWQKQLVLWALKLGRAAFFADCGLGKTFMQLEWARHVYEETRAPVLVLCPLAVAAQTLREAGRFGIEGVKYCRSQEEVMGETRIIVTNYERLEKFDTGVRRRGARREQHPEGVHGQDEARASSTRSATRFKLCCTATPAPNDVMELGNHCEFLGVMDSHEMLARFFINDSMNMGTYRLKGHAEADFWRWVCSWAACLSTPSDLLDSRTGKPYSAHAATSSRSCSCMSTSSTARTRRLTRASSSTCRTSTPPLIYAEARRTAAARALRAAELVAAEPDEPGSSGATPTSRRTRSPRRSVR